MQKHHLLTLKYTSLCIWPLTYKTTTILEFLLLTFRFEYLIAFKFIITDSVMIHSMTSNFKFDDRSADNLVEGVSDTEENQFLPQFSSVQYARPVRAKNDDKW